MHSPSPSLATTLRALRGESDVHIVAPALNDIRFACVLAPALNDIRFACVLALAPDIDPGISAPGALANKVPDVLPPAMRGSPALAAAVASLIGTDAGARILPW